MDEAEAQRMRAEILEDVGAILREQLAGDEWGRVQIEVVRAPDGEPAVAGIDVEEIVGEEARVDAVFGGDAVRAVLPALAKSAEALCAIEGVDVEEVRGGTFVHHGEGFAFLPGLVRAPSPRFDRERDALVARVRTKNEALRARFGAQRVDFDVPSMTLRWMRDGRAVGEAAATLIGSFVNAARTWGWAWSNPTAPEAVKRASAALTDAIEERDLWEIATPVFATDEPTAWALAALVCDRAGGEGVQRLAHEDGALFVLVRGAREV
jgi:hypothetical protein